MIGRATLLNSCVGEYRVVDFLGAGGMGEVYRAVHTKLGRIVAVKVLTRAGENAALKERFFNEARIQASLHHPAVATLYDFLEIAGLPCIIMEYVDGESLADLIRIRGALPSAQSLSILHTILEAVDYIHNHGIVHRDIKSNNIKVTSTGQVKLLDFGIAKSDSTPRITAAGDVIGTMEYLSPEQLKSGMADARSDIWALGVLLYEMVTGVLPFEARTLGDLYEKVSTVDYRAPRALNPSVPLQVEMLISGCLKKNPSDRFQSVRQMLLEIENLRAGYSSHVAGPAPAPKTNWLIWFATAAVLLIAVVIGFLSLIPTSEPKPSRQEAARPTPQTQRTLPAEHKAVQIETSEGPARVFIEGREVGSTPYLITAKPGERVSLILRREGFIDKPVELTVGDNQRPYTFTLSKQEQ